MAWVGREALSALPIWCWAFWGGTSLEWRGRKFWVGMDMKVHEIINTSREPTGGHATLNGQEEGEERIGKAAAFCEQPIDRYTS